MLAADARLTALAQWLQRRGAARTISQLRAAVYTALLNGRPLDSLLADLVASDAAAAGSGTAPESSAASGAAQDAARDAAAADNGAEDGEAARDDDSGDAAAPRAARGSGAAGPDAATADEVVLGGALGWPAVSGTIHLTMPLSAFLGGGEPGEVAGHGPVDAATSRELAAMLARSTATRWCITLTGPAAAPPAMPAAPAASRPASPSSRGRRACSPGCRCWRPGSATTPASRRATSRRTCCGTSSESGSAGAATPAAAAPQCAATWTTQRRSIRADAPANATSRRCAGGIIRPSKHPAGCWNSPSPAEMTWRTPSGRVYETTGDPDDRSPITPYGPDRPSTPRPVRHARPVRHDRCTSSGPGANHDLLAALPGLVTDRTSAGSPLARLTLSGHDVLTFTMMSGLHTGDSVHASLKSRGLQAGLVVLTTVGMSACSANRAPSRARPASNQTTIPAATATVSAAATTAASNTPTASPRPATSGGVQNLVSNSTVRGDLTAAFVAHKGISPSDVVVPIPALSITPTIPPPTHIGR